VDDLTPAQWQPPQQPGVNPIAWELAHLAWFAEFWILRGPHSRNTEGFSVARHASRFAGPDALFDSARLSHSARWTEKMPTRPQLESMLHSQLDACIDAIGAIDSSSDADLYFHRLALFHEDMHGEAFCWMRSALGYPAPVDVSMPQVTVSTPLSVTGGSTRIGLGADSPGFAFDNELRAHEITLRDFEIDSAPVTGLQFSRFVDAGGYGNAQFWPGAAGTWWALQNPNHPARWRRNSAGNWETRWFDQWQPLQAGSPAMHINAFEAEAYCLWAGRRLPSAAEWEHAALSKANFQWGRSVWEWTADAFAPYPGFAPGPYREYSEPWFGDHRELRGGAFATIGRMDNPRYRNFFMPHRSDIFSGFRTVAA
jgi:ergothioneine biosynthesis protein EgtB